MEIGELGSTLLEFHGLKSGGSCSSKAGALVQQKKRDQMLDGQKSRFPLRGALLWQISPGSLTA